MRDRHARNPLAARCSIEVNQIAQIADLIADQQKDRNSIDSKKIHQDCVAAFSQRLAPRNHPHSARDGQRLAMSDQLKKLIVEQTLAQYLNSRDFNGLSTVRLKSADERSIVKSLVLEGKLDLVRGDGHPNPHIKAYAAEPIAVQLEKIDANGLAGCLYPTPQLLIECGAGTGETAPYTRALKEGAPQLSYRCFDLRSLEWYRNDPRFDFSIDDVHGRIIQKPGTQIADRAVTLDGLEFLEFGFAYNEEMNRAIAVFLRYLHDLPEAQQIELKRYELAGQYNLHPDFIRTQLIGDFPERISIYDALLLEKSHINSMCKLMGKPPIFKSEHTESRRPHGFGILLRPTRKEFRDFALLLDQLLSDDINRDFFKGDMELNRSLTDETGKVEKLPIGTIQLLQDWITSRFEPKEPEPLNQVFARFRKVRAVRQLPAHKNEDNEFDQKYLAEQRELIGLAFDAIRTLRMVFENHPKAKSHKVPDYLREGKVWTY